MALVVHVEPVVDRVVLEIGDEAGDVDDGHAGAPASAGATSLPREPRTATVAPMDDDRAPRGAARHGRRAVATPWAASTTGAWPAPGPASTAATWPPTTRRWRCSSGPGVGRAERGVGPPPTATTAWSSWSIPLDGSTNASRGMPWYATSLCAVDADGPRAALVVDLAQRHPVRGGAGRRRPGRRCRRSDPRAAGGWARRSSACRATRRAGSGGSSSARSGRRPSTSARWPAGGSTATSTAARAPTAPWDYLGGLLVCQEAGAVVVDASRARLVMLDHAARRTPVAAATPELLAEAVAARRAFSA